MIIDRRKLGLNTNLNVIKFIKRYKRYSAQEYQVNIQVGNDFEQVNTVSLDQPTIRFDYDTGIYDIVTAGNDLWSRGDTIKSDIWEQYMQLISGAGSGSSDDSDEEDESIFEWSQEDKAYINTLFEDLNLPNLSKKSVETNEIEIVRSGYSLNGGNVDLMKTFFMSFARRMALKAPIENEIKELKKKKNQKHKILELEEINKKIPFIDDMDVRFKRFEKQIVLSTKVVIFLVLDVSGSMSLERRRLAKLFSKLVVSFLERKYDNCKVEYITFANSANRVSQKDFFYKVQYGGTVLSSALELELEILKEYDSSWNKYSLIFSDTELSADDIEISQTLLQDILKLHQFLIYVNVDEDSERFLDYLVEPFRRRNNFTFCTVENEEEIITEFIKIFS